MAAQQVAVVEALGVLMLSISAPLLSSSTTAASPGPCRRRAITHVMKAKALCMSSSPHLLVMRVEMVYCEL